MKSLSRFHLNLLLRMFALFLCLNAFRLGLVEAESEQPEFTPGASAPNFSLRRLNSEETLSLGDFKGKYVLLNFWATWCAPCIAEMPALERVQQVLGPSKLKVVAISVDTESAQNAVSEFVKRQGLSFTILLDPSLKSAEKYRAEGFPETFLISPQGDFVEIFDSLEQRRSVRIISDRPWDSPAYLQALRDAIGETPPKKTSSPPLKK